MNIYLIDDDPDQLDLLEQIISETFPEHKVTTFSSWKQAKIEEGSFIWTDTQGVHLELKEEKIPNNCLVIRWTGNSADSEADYHKPLGLDNIKNIVKQNLNILNERKSQ